MSLNCGNAKGFGTYDVIAAFTLKIAVLFELNMDRNNFAQIGLFCLALRSERLMIQDKILPLLSHRSGKTLSHACSVILGDRYQCLPVQSLLWEISPFLLFVRNFSTMAISHHVRVAC